MTNLAQRLEAATKLPAPRTRRAIRNDAGISQQEIADEIGVHRMTIARWEAGTHQPRGDRLVQYFQIIEQMRLASL